MAEYDVAHIHEQGQDLIIIPMAERFQFLPDKEQRDVMASLQVCATAAGLRGTVVPVWNNGGRTAFIAPQPWHPFFQSIDLGFVAANINRRLTCG